MSSTGYHISAYAIDGERMGQKYQAYADLSQKWIEHTAEFLEHYGETFDESWGQELGHIRTKLTSANGSGMATFYANDLICTSSLLLSGLDPKTDEEVASMFIDLFGQGSAVDRTSTEQNPFETIRLIELRPLYVVVPWGHDETSEMDDDLIAELSKHFAAAFFTKHLGASNQPPHPSGILGRLRRRLGQK